jgi:hypothetical protein
MRSDMVRVLCEEPRSGMRTKDRKGRKRAEHRIPDDEKPCKEKGNLRSRWTSDYYDHKEFGDHIAPLRRFVLSCVGRKWDEVYSEIRKVVPYTGVVNQHLYSHLFQYVATKVYIEQGRVYSAIDNRRYSSGSPIYQPTYVHPETGILCKNPELDAPRKKKTEVKNYVKGNNEKQLFVRDVKTGLWWECTLAHCLPGEQAKRQFLYSRAGAFFYYTRYPETFDVLLRQNVHQGSRVLMDYYGSYGLYCIKTRQLNKREIKKLRNRLTTAA